MHDKKYRRLQLRLFIVMQVAFSLVAVSTMAQPLVQKSFSTQLFEPAIGQDTLLTVEPALVSRHLAFDIDLLTNYQYRPLVVTTAGISSTDGEDVSLVEHQLTTDLTSAVGLHYGWLKAQVGVALPIHLLISGEELDEMGEVEDDYLTTGLGDLRLQLKALIFENLRGFSLSFSPIITFPTACIEAGGKPCDEKGKYGGDPNWSFRPRLVADFRHHDLLFAVNIGWMFRQDSWVFSTPMGDRLLYALGAAYQITDNIRLSGELFGAAGFTDGGCRTVDNNLRVCDDESGVVEKTPLELALAGRYYFDSGFTGIAGLGVGILQAYGTPLFRIVAGVEWAPDFTDSDKDGLSNEVDKCPNQKEDKDNFEDEDGCPDIDNDQDMILDSDDKCPNQAEDLDKYQDSDGCPEKDNDKDGVFDGFDSCPQVPEDRDNYHDEDGCPDLDNDQDGIEDDKDTCPTEKETINGNADQDGCPDEGDPEVIVEDGQIVLNARIRISDREKTFRKYHSILEQLALTLKAHQSIRGIKIIVYTTSRKKVKSAQKKAENIAEMVRTFLQERGVQKERLSTEGEVIGKKTYRKRQSNLELLILDQMP